MSQHEPLEWFKGLTASDRRWFWHVGGSVVRRCLEQAQRQEEEAARRRVIAIDSLALSPEEIRLIDETARITPLQWEKLAEATRALRTKPAQPAKQRQPLHKPQPWNPPVARRRKR